MPEKLTYTSAQFRSDLRAENMKKVLRECGKELQDTLASLMGMVATQTPGISQAFFADQEGGKLITFNYGTDQNGLFRTSIAENSPGDTLKYRVYLAISQQINALQLLVNLSQEDSYIIRVFAYPPNAKNKPTLFSADEMTPVVGYAFHYWQGENVLSTPVTDFHYSSEGTIDYPSITFSQLEGGTNIVSTLRLTHDPLEQREVTDPYPQGKTFKIVVPEAESREIIIPSKLTSIDDVALFIRYQWRRAIALTSLHYVGK